MNIEQLKHRYDLQYIRTPFIAKQLNEAWHNLLEAADRANCPLVMMTGKLDNGVQLSACDVHHLRKMKTHGD